MVDNFSINSNPARVTVRDELIKTINELHTEKNIPLQAILVELLYISSNLVDEEENLIKESVGIVVGFDMEPIKPSHDNDSYEYECEDLYKDIDEYNFTSKYVGMNIVKLSNEIDRQKRLNKYSKALELNNKVLEVMYSYAKLGERIDSEFIYQEYDFFISHALFSMQASVVKQDRELMENVMKIAIEMHNFLGDKEFDIEVFKHEYSKHSDDLNEFKVIHKFIKDNEGFHQSKLYKELSLEGRKTAYILECADNFGILNRKRYKNTWLLSTAL